MRLRVITMSALSALAASAVGAMACVIDMPTCKVGTSGRFAQLAHSDLLGQSASVFEEYGFDGDDRRQVFIVECASRQGVSAEDLAGDSDTLGKAQDYLVEAALSERSFGLDEIRRKLERMGLSAARITLPDGHCGCDLPKMPLVGCGNAP